MINDCWVSELITPNKYLSWSNLHDYETKKFSTQAEVPFMISVKTLKDSAPTTQIS